MENRHFEVAIVGGGIIGLAHAYVAARAGRTVAVFERSPRALGASVRNFGMIWPIGQSPGAPLHLALRSREIWKAVLSESGIPYRNTGSLHAAYRPDEAAVAEEFASRGPDLGYSCAWLNAQDALLKSTALRSDGLLGALWSSTELTVDPRQVVARLPDFLAGAYGVRFFFSTAVRHVESSCVVAGQQTWRADSIVIAAGDDFQTLFPHVFEDCGLTRSKLQMMRTAAQPASFDLGPSLAFGLSFKHYPSFQICPSLDALKRRIAAETPELERWGIHVMASQTSRGEITLGDSHEYGLAVNIFDNPLIDDLILRYARERMRLPFFEIAERWHGVYAKHPHLSYLRLSPQSGVQIVTVTSGVGMTLSFGLAEETFGA